MTTRPRDTILARIPVHGQQQLHLRLREVKGLPAILDLAQFNVADEVHRQATPFPDDPEVLRQLIEALIARMDEHAEPGLEEME